mgnify:CR=1 FL=1
MYDYLVVGSGLYGATFAHEAHQHALISSIVMGLCVYLVSCFISNIYAELVLEIIVGVVVYVAISLISKNETFCLLTGVLKDKLHIHKN